MGYKCKILKDSVSEGFGHRITTFQVSFPRIVLSELNTHRVFSRNYSSSRAIPVSKMINQVIDDPFIPVYWGKNQQGMSAFTELDYTKQQEARHRWLQARYEAINSVTHLIDNCNLHKQIANRLLEPWMWATGIITSTEYNNFFNLRCHPAAQPEIKVIAEMMREEYLHSTPDVLRAGEWHIPMLTPAEESSWNTEIKLKVATGRLARVSYLTHEGVRDMNKDIELHDSLLINRHLSPFEHCAFAYPSNKPQGNFVGWKQYRKLIAGESGVK